MGKQTNQIDTTDKTLSMVLMTYPVINNCTADVDDESNIT